MASAILRVISLRLSDHCKQIIHLRRSEGGSKPFWMYGSWLQNQEYKTMVTNAWVEEVTRIVSYNLVNKLSKIKTLTKSWSKRLLPIAVRIQRGMEDLHNTNIVEDPTMKNYNISEKSRKVP